MLPDRACRGRPLTVLGISWLNRGIRPLRSPASGFPNLAKHAPEPYAARNEVRSKIWGAAQRNPDPGFSAPTNSSPVLRRRAPLGAVPSTLQLSTEQELFP